MLQSLEDQMVSQSGHIHLPGTHGATKSNWIPLNSKVRFSLWLS